MHLIPVHGYYINLKLRKMKKKTFGSNLTIILFVLN